MCQKNACKGVKFQGKQQVSQCDVPLECYLFCLYTVHFSLALLNVNQQNASWHDTTQCAALVVADWLVAYVENRPENGGQCNHYLPNLSWLITDLEICNTMRLATQLPFLWWIQNSDSAFIGRRDKPLFCSFHNTARFLFEKYTEYVNRHYQMMYIKFGDDWMRSEQANWKTRMRGGVWC